MISANNFNNYRSTLAKVPPPCVPSIGISIMTLTNIQDRSKDTLPGGQLGELPKTTGSFGGDPRSSALVDVPA